MNLSELSKLFKHPLSWCRRQEKLHVIKQIKKLKEQVDKLLDLLYQCKEKEVWFVQDQLEIINKKLNTLKKRKIFLNQTIKNHKAEENNKPIPNPIINYDIDQIKKVPIDRITEILPSGFFKNNPFRRERSPSNSLHLNKKTNQWTDFGSGEFGSNVDLVMVLENCNFKEALKYLSLHF